MNEELIRQRWLWIKDHVRTEYRLSNISYKTFIENLEIADIRDHTVYIRISSDKPIMLDYIVNNFKVFFQITITEMLDENYDVEFLLSNETKKEEEPVREHISMVSSQQIENANLNPKYRFDTFIVGSNNKFAQSACVAVAESPGNTYNPLFLYGGAGLGKTHLMHSIGHYILEMSPSKRVLYVTSEQFTNEVIESIRSGNAQSMARLRDKYRTVDVLLIDDIQFIIGKESTQEEFFHTFNSLHQNQKQIVMTSDRPISEIANLQERLVSRFEWGLVTEMDMVDFETRVAILRRKREELMIQLGDECLMFIAQHVKSNIRKLEGSMLRVASYASLTRKAPTTETLEYLLRDTIEQENQTALSIEGIQRMVAEYYDIRLGDMTSKQRPQNIAFPRQVAMYLCRELTGQSLPSIGNSFGRNHATVLHAHRSVGAKMKKDANLRQTVLSLQQRLGGVSAPS